MWVGVLWHGSAWYAMRGLHSKWNVELEAAWVWACLTTDTRDEGIANGHGPCWTEGTVWLYCLCKRICTQVRSKSASRGSLHESFSQYFNVTLKAYVCILYCSPCAQLMET